MSTSNKNIILFTNLELKKVSCTLLRGKVTVILIKADPQPHAYSLAVCGYAACLTLILPIGAARLNIGPYGPELIWHLG